MALFYHETTVPIVLGDRVRMIRGRHGHAGLGTVVYLHPVTVQIRLDNPSRGEGVITVPPRSFDQFIMVAEARVVAESDETALPGVSMANASQLLFEFARVFTEAGANRELSLQEFDALVAAVRSSMFSG